MKIARGKQYILKDIACTCRMCVFEPCKFEGILVLLLKEKTSFNTLTEVCSDIMITLKRHNKIAYMVHRDYYGHILKLEIGSTVQEPDSWMYLLNL